MKMPELKTEVFNFVAAVCLVAITVLLFIISLS
jgi:hypothetical protein